MDQKEQKEQILKLLKEKSVMKQDVYKNTLETFDSLSKVVKEISRELKDAAANIDKRLVVESRVTSDHEMEFKVAGDMLVFYMHTNVFQFEKSHPMFKTGYIKESDQNSYCGIINVYNFLADSFKFNRLNDLGYLICRIFVNREKRFFVESRSTFAYRYNHFSTEPLNEEILADIVNELVVHAISFDLYTPPSETVREVSLNEIQERVQSDKLKTGKRLGFRAHGEIGFSDEE